MFKWVVQKYEGLSVNLRYWIENMGLELKIWFLLVELQSWHGGGGVMFGSFR